MNKNNIESFTIIDVKTENMLESIVVNKDKLLEFFRFLETKADYFSLECYYFGKLSREEYADIKREGMKYLESQYEAYKNNTDNYRETLKNVMDITTEKEAKRYFKEMEKEYKQNILAEAKRQKGKDPRIDENRMKEIGMIEYGMTCNTPSTMGGVRTICYFPAEHLIETVGNMTTLYDYINVDGFEFENLTCYAGDFHNNDSDFYITTTHELYSGLSLEHQEYQMLVDNDIFIP